ncbi:MAG: NAD(P)-dependent alcohol dehydrogenase [Sedimenticola sp.]|nr:NAD(P)-dependent alcohol dehydrogenase [Sedimenticola sp.]
MKAIVYSEYGTPDVLHISELEKPIPKDNEVLIKIYAAEVTKADCELRSFNFPVKWFWLPLRIVMGITKPKRPVLGGYFSGEIESVGRDVTAFNPGDTIFGATKLRMGAYAEYLCLPDDYTMAAKPDNISFDEAAAVPLGGLNALHFLRKADIKPGDKVLINGAGGSIGTFAVQIAKAMGAEVTAVDSAMKEEMLRQIGADHFIDYTRDHFSANDKTYDVIFDMVAKSSYSDCINSLKSKGRYLMGNPRLSDMLRSFFTPLFSDKSVLFAFAGETKEELNTLKKMIEAGTIRPAIDKIFMQDQAAAAHHRVETEQRIGIVVLSMNK